MPGGEHVRVCLRIRPLIERERLEQAGRCIRVVPGRHQVVIGERRAFTYDEVLDEKSTHDQLYGPNVAPLVEGMFEGINATVMAYGQTGSGKTYTMGGHGAGSGAGGGAAAGAGIIPRAVHDVWNRVAASPPSTAYKLSVSFLEVHREVIRDLIPASSDFDGSEAEDRYRGAQRIAIREDSEGRVVVAGAREVLVESEEETMRVFRAGVTGRTVGSTRMNEASSRSHAIFILTMVQTTTSATSSSASPSSSSSSAVVAPPVRLCSQLYMVDLAGSERAKRTKAAGLRFLESININQGLLVLGKVIAALGGGDGQLRRLSHRQTQGGGAGAGAGAAAAAPTRGRRVGSRGRLHVPYRESKLTRLLQDALGGNSRTLLVACVTAADTSFDETINTLKYADRARKIRNKPVVNHLQSEREKERERLREEANIEVRRLKAEVEALKTRRATEVVEGSSLGANLAAAADRNREQEKKEREKRATVTAMLLGRLQAHGQRLQHCARTLGVVGAAARSVADTITGGAGGDCSVPLRPALRQDCARQLERVSAAATTAAEASQSESDAALALLTVGKAQATEDGGSGAVAAAMAHAIATAKKPESPAKANKRKAEKPRLRVTRAGTVVPSQASQVPDVDNDEGRGRGKEQLSFNEVVPLTLDEAVAQTGSSSSAAVQELARLRSDLARAQEDLAMDESIFAGKMAEMTTLQSRVQEEWEENERLRDALALHAATTSGSTAAGSTSGSKGAGAGMGLTVDPDPSFTQSIRFDATSSSSAGAGAGAGAARHDDDDDDDVLMASAEEEEDTISGMTKQDMEDEIHALERRLAVLAKEEAADERQQAEEDEEEEEKRRRRRASASSDNRRSSEIKASEAHSHVARLDVRVEELEVELASLRTRLSAVGQSGSAVDLLDSLEDEMEGLEAILAATKRRRSRAQVKAKEASAIATADASAAPPSESSSSSSSARAAANEEDAAFVQRQGERRGRATARARARDEMKARLHELLDMEQLLERRRASRMHNVQHSNRRIRAVQGREGGGGDVPPRASTATAEHDEGRRRRHEKAAGKRLGTNFSAGLLCCTSAAAAIVVVVVVVVVARCRRTEWRCRS